MCYKNTKDNKMGVKIGSMSIVGTWYEEKLSESITLGSLNNLLSCCERISKGSYLDREHLDTIGNGFLYFLLKGDEVVYIGATNTTTRIMQHSSKKDFDTARVLKCHSSIHWYMENALITRFRPPLNKQVIKNDKPLISNSIKRMLLCIQNQK